MFQVLLLPHFLKQLKLLLRKYPLLKESIIFELEKFDPKNHISLGRHLSKVRLRIKGLPKGKSGSFRLILQVIQESNIILPILIYFKGDIVDVKKKEIIRQQKIILAELGGEQSRKS